MTVSEWNIEAPSRSSRSSHAPIQAAESIAAATDQTLAAAVRAMVQAAHQLRIVKCGLRAMAIKEQRTTSTRMIKAE